MKRRCRIKVQRWTAKEGWWDCKVIELWLPYYLIHFQIGQLTVGISRIWLGFSKRHTGNHFIADLGFIKIMRKKESEA